MTGRMRGLTRQAEPTVDHGRPTAAAPRKGLSSRLQCFPRTGRVGFHPIGGDLLPKQTAYTA